MSVSFIVTTYNVAPYVDRALASVAEVARPGDEVIVVDDGSSDATPERIAAAVLPGGVAFRPILFGANSWGGVGVAANVGLDHATGDTVFFVDGDDWIDAGGFRTCRRLFEHHDWDVLIADYREWDERAGEGRNPADRRRWRRLDLARAGRVARTDALAFIAVPWRKFYRRTVLDGIRFPEGDFFFEDNPFHWAVCLKADTIAAAEHVVAWHRVNRPGQTMGAQGLELAAFFDHYTTIRGLLPTGSADLEAAALTWLLNNMAWQLPRLRAAARPGYLLRAADTLGGVAPGIWQAVWPDFADKPLGPVVDLLRRGDLATVLAHLARTDLAPLEDRVARLEKTLGHVRHRIDGLAALKTYAALRALDQRRPLEE